MSIKTSLTEIFARAGQWGQEHPMKMFSALSILYDFSMAMNANPHAGQASFLWAAAAIPAWIGHGVSIWRGDNGPRIQEQLLDFKFKNIWHEAVNNVKFIKETFTTRALFNEMAEDMKGWRNFGENALNSLKIHKDPYAFLYAMTTLTGLMLAADGSNVFDTRADWNMNDTAIGAGVTTASAYSLITRNPQTGARIFAPLMLPVAASALKPAFQSIVQSVQSGQISIDAPNLAMTGCLLLGIYMNYTMSKIIAARQLENQGQPKRLPQIPI